MLHEIRAVEGRFAPGEARLRIAANQLDNVPQPVRDAVDATGLRVLIYSGDNITQLPEFADLATADTNAVGDDRTYDDVGSVGPGRGFAAVIRGSDLVERSPFDGPDGGFSGSVLLHEYGHAVDEVFEGTHDDRRDETGAGLVSGRPEWREGPHAELVASQNADGLSDNVYHEANPGEWFAESFSQYTYSPQSNERLLQGYPQTHAFLQQLVGAPSFTAEDDEGLRPRT